MRVRDPPRMIHWRLLQPQHMLAMSHRKNIRVDPAAGRHALTVEAERLRRILRHEINGRHFVGIGHVARVADMGRDLLLVVATERILGIVDIVLDREQIHPDAPELLHVRHAATVWLQVITRCATRLMCGLVELEMSASFTRVCTHIIS